MMCTWTPILIAACVCVLTPRPPLPLPPPPTLSHTLLCNSQQQQEEGRDFAFSSLLLRRLMFFFSFFFFSLEYRLQRVFVAFFGVQTKWGGKAKNALHLGWGKNENPLLVHPIFLI